MSVVPRLLYTRTKDHPEGVLPSGMKTSINSLRNDSFRIIILWYHGATGVNSFLNKTHCDIMEKAPKSFYYIFVLIPLIS